MNDECCNKEGCSEEEVNAPCDAPTVKTPVVLEHRSMTTKDMVSVKKIDMDKALAWFTDKLLPILKEEYPEDAGVFADAMSEVALTATVAYQEIKEATGLIEKIGIIGGAVENIAAEVEKLAQVADIPGARKKEIVITIATQVYEVVDKGFDGGENNVNIADILPSWLGGFVPTGASDKIERWILSIVFSLAIDAVVAAWHRYGQG